MSVPNQKVITIHQSQQIPFLKIGIEELLEAYRNIKTPSSFVLYLYLASNKDGYKLELSKEAFSNATNYSKSSYHRAVEHLTKLGYIYEDYCGRLNFKTTPKEGSRTQTQNWENECQNLKHSTPKDETSESQICNITNSKANTEINNKEIINRIDNPSSLKDYSYLHNIIGEDGYYGNGQYLDGNVDRQFWERPREYQIDFIEKNTSFSRDEIIYALDNIVGT